VGYISAIAVADLAGDGKLDLILTDGGSYGGGEVIVLRGNGDGTFQPAEPYGVGGLYNSPPVLVDLNGDHKLDLAMSIGMCEAFNSQSCVGVMLGNGDGTFQTAIRYSLPGVGAMSLATGDVNGDDIPDLLVASQCGKFCTVNGGGINLLLGNGDGTFQQAIFYGSGGTTTWVGTADLRNKHHLDMVAASRNGNIGTAAVLLNNRSSGSTATSAQVASSVNPSVFGQNVTFTATISSTAGKPANGERVTFTNGMSFLGVGRLNNGVASFTTSSLPGAVASVRAIYNGDAKFAGTAAPPIAQVVKATTGQTSTVTDLLSSANPSVQGKTLTFSATVSPQQGAGTPTGKVTFLDGGAILCTRSLGHDGSNCAGSALAPGTHSIRAVYLGNSTYDISTSATISQVVLAASTTSLTSTPNPSTSGESVVFTATVTSSIGAPPDGETIAFKRGTTVIGTGTLSGGSATFTTSTLPVGTIGITAAYAGDTSFAGSTSKLLKQVVGKTP
jgi:Bacterial Ig-like domain (group 3)/FG-GAP-like repeat